MNRVLLFAAVSLLIPGCGRSPEALGIVAGEPVTLEEYLAVFENLTPDRQVEVFEPGGRMALMRNIVTKRLILAASRATPASDADFWTDLYSTAWLADSLSRSLAYSFDPQPLLDSLDASVYTLQVVLMEDSAMAFDTASLWRHSGPSDPGTSVFAPWSDETGSSYRTLHGPPWQFPFVFLSSVQARDGGPVVTPLYGAWLVAAADATGDEAVPDRNAGMAVFGWELDSVADVRICASTLNRFIRGEELSKDTELAWWDHGSLTVGKMEDILEKVIPGSFPGGVPPELSPFHLHLSGGNHGASVWLSVLSTSRTMALADIAREAGASAPVSTEEYAASEALVRERILIPSFPDSSLIAFFYEENMERYRIPERRSVLLGYVETGDLDGVSGAESFSDLTGFHTMADSQGVPIPTPLKPMEQYGGVLGERIFSAAPGSFQGPVDMGEDIWAFFQVVAWSPSETLPLEAVYDRIGEELLLTRFEGSFASFVDSLAVQFGVEVDTTAVQRVDPWTGSLR